MRLTAVDICSGNPADPADLGELDFARALLLFEYSTPLREEK